jgi:hypothetical protein
MGKEKVKGFQEEGMRNQSVHRSGSSKMILLNRLSKLVVGLLAILGILDLLR